MKRVFKLGKQTAEINEEAIFTAKSDIETIILETSAALVIRIK